MLDYEGITLDRNGVRVEEGIGIKYIFPLVCFNKDYYII